MLYPDLTYRQAAGPHAVLTAMLTVIALGALLLVPSLGVAVHAVPARQTGHPVARAR
jgi:hypothetical protein